MSIHKGKGYVNFQLGRWGVTVAAERRGDSYGRRGAKSFVFSVATWLNPEKS